MTNKLPSAAINATGAPSGRTTTPSSVRPGFVSPRHHRDQLDDGAGSFWPTLWLTCTIAGGGIVVAVIFQLCTGTLWGFAS